MTTVITLPRVAFVIFVTLYNGPFITDDLITDAIKFHAIINNKLRYIDARSDR